MLYGIHPQVPNCTHYFNCLRLAYPALKCWSRARYWVTHSRIRFRSYGQERAVERVLASNCTFAKIYLLLMGE